jgi:hypothetical protein
VTNEVVSRNIKFFVELWCLSTYEVATANDTKDS